MYKQVFHVPTQGPEADQRRNEKLPQEWQKYNCNHSSCKSCSKILWKWKKVFLSSTLHLFVSFQLMLLYEWFDNLNRFQVWLWVAAEAVWPSLSWWDWPWLSAVCLHRDRAVRAGDAAVGHPGQGGHEVWGCWKSSTFLSISAILCCQNLVHIWQW